MIYNILRSTPLILMMCILCMKIAYAAEIKDSVRIFIDNNAQKILNVLANDPDPNTKQNKLSELFHEIVDTEWMAKFAVALNWNNMTSTQQIDYMSAYKNYLTKSYVKKFVEFNGQQYTISKITKIGSNQFLAETQIINKNTSQPNVIVSYRIKKTEEKMHVIDIIAEGVSLLSTQRTEFSSIIAQKGVDSFIQTIKAKS